MKVEYSGSKNYVADLCRMSQVNGCKGRQVFQTCTRMFIEDWFLRVGTDWRALERPFDKQKKLLVGALGSNSVPLRKTFCFCFKLIPDALRLNDFTLRAEC